MLIQASNSYETMYKEFYDEKFSGYKIRVDFAEGSSFPPRKPEVLEFVSRRKCERCLKEEKVDLGSDLHF